MIHIILNRLQLKTVHKEENKYIRPFCILLVYGHHKKRTIERRTETLAFIFSWYIPKTPHEYLISRARF